MRGAARAAVLLTTCRAFYLPGVAPRTFRYGDKVELKVNKLTSVHTQIPYDYYSLKFCRPRGGIKQATENLGECARGVPSCFHFLGWTRGHLTMPGVFFFFKFDHTGS
jgi:transmembrane 9 superfamily protein 2/4